MPKTSAGILLFRRHSGSIQVLLVHPGGPFWKDRDEGAWSIPKGEIADGEPALDAARREFEEETGFTLAGPFEALAPVKQKSGKVVYAWAAEEDLDPGAMRSNTFTMEWPPRSGVQRTFPEADCASWFSIPDAARKINAGQVPLLRELAARLGGG